MVFIGHHMGPHASEHAVASVQLHVARCNEPFHTQVVIMYDHGSVC